MLSAFRNFLLTFIVSSLIFGVCAYFTVGLVLDAMSGTISGDDTTVESGDGDTINKQTDTKPRTDTEPPFVEEINGETFNILLIGTDYQPGIFDDYDYFEKWTGDGFPDKPNRPWRADAIIFLRVDKENRQFVFCSIPSNTKMFVDGEYMQLCDVLSKKGINYFSGKVSGLLGVTLDYHAVISVEAIAECVDAIGTVTYYVPENMKYDDSIQNLVIDLKKGTTNVDGAKAAQLLRYAGYKNGNAGRINTIIEFAKAMLAKFTNVTYLDRADDFYNAVVENIETNFTIDDLMNNLDLIFSYSKFEVLNKTYPGSNKQYNGVVYFEPSIAAAMKMFD